MAEGIEALHEWIGRTREAADMITAAPLAAMSATLDRADPTPEQGDPLPPGWHWLFFHDAAPQAELGDDGHPRRGGFLPPVPLPRRMYAGGRLAFKKPLVVGETVRRVSEVTAVTSKHGRSGDLVIVVVRHSVFGEAGIAIEEEQDLIFREAARPNAPQPVPRPAPADAEWARTIHPDPVMLFRYSALTFNGHRIHYDRGYCTDSEGYPGLVVHGPLTASLLMDLWRRHHPDAPLGRFTFRALWPLFDTGPFTVGGKTEGGGAALWAVDGAGALAMQAEAVAT